MSQKLVRQKRFEIQSLRVQASNLILVLEIQHFPIRCRHHLRKSKPRRSVMVNSATPVRKTTANSAALTSGQEVVICTLLRFRLKVSATSPSRQLLILAKTSPDILLLCCTRIVPWLLFKSTRQALFFFNAVQVLLIVFTSSTLERDRVWPSSDICTLQRLLSFGLIC
jgi:hypothetical protein